MSAVKPSPVSAEPDVPEGWLETNLEDCAKLITKGTTPTTYGLKYRSSGIAFIRVENLVDGRIDTSSISAFIDQTTNRALKRSQLRPGDILFSIAGTIGRTALVRATDLPANTNQALAIVRGTDSILLPAFLRMFLESSVAQRQASNEARGGAMNNISLADVRALQVPIPPQAEQKRIVEKAEKLLVRINAARERLARVPAILKRFRQAVLAAACSGRLTEDWHNSKAQRAGPGVQAPAEIDLPDAWKKAELGKIAVLVSGVGFPEKYQNRHGLSYPFFKVGNLGEVASGMPLTESKHTIDDQLVRELRARVLPAGSIVFAKIGMAIALNRRRMLGRPACIDNNMMAAIPTDTVVPSYLLGFLETIDFMPLTQATTVPSIRKLTLAELPVPLPPKDEQAEIVRRVEALFRLTDTIERRVETARKRAEKITQAILAKALRGELVPTEAELARHEGRDYEPASVLVERIRAERNSPEGRPTSLLKRRSVRSRRRSHHSP